MTLRRRITAIVLGVMLALGGLGAGAALAAGSSGPPVTAPSSGPGPYYSGPVHECVSVANESVSYTEEHSTGLGNCAAGYRQLAVNELTPAFTLQLGTVVYDCTAATDQASTALTCSTTSTASPSPTPTATTSG